MKVCYFGTYDEAFPRNRVLIQGLLENGVQVVRCQAKVWSGTQDKIAGVLGFRKNPLAPSLVRRVLGGYLQLLREYRKVGPYDIMLVGYAGHFDMLLARLLSRLGRKPLVFDAFLSLYATVVEDRNLVGPASPLARVLRLVDKLSCSLADLVFLDTQAHIDWYSRRYRLPKERFRRVLMGALPHPFAALRAGSNPLPEGEGIENRAMNRVVADGPVRQGGGGALPGRGPADGTHPFAALRAGSSPLPKGEGIGSHSGARTGEEGGPFKVLYFGNFIPLHGVEHVLGAAWELRGHTEMIFELVGEGQTYEAARRMADERALSNVAFVHGWFSLDQLAGRARSADVCLGIFGAGPKAEMVIPQKVVFALALGLPVVTRDSPAIREIFTPGRDIMVCQPGSPQSLAAALLALKRDVALRQDIGRGGYRLFQRHFCPRAVGGTVREHLLELCRAG